MASVEGHGIDAGVGHVPGIDAQAHLRRIERVRDLLDLVLELDVAAGVLVQDGCHAVLERHVGDPVDEPDHVPEARRIEPLPQVRAPGRRHSLVRQMIDRDEVPAAHRRQQLHRAGRDLHDGVGLGRLVQHLEDEAGHHGK